MCGIVGAIAKHDVSAMLLEGLQRLEYRGYDSAGMALINGDSIQRLRRLGKVSELQQAVQQYPIDGHIGIAHTRWATHGVPSEKNAHPHISTQRIAIVHNGIIENFQTLKDQQIERGFTFSSDTDTEVIVHQIVYYLNQQQDLLAAVKHALADLVGAYALAVIDKNDPSRIIAARQGSPLVLGIGQQQHFIASDVQALLKYTQQFIYLENGDVVDIGRDQVVIHDQSGQQVERPIKHSEQNSAAAEKGDYAHYMLKEIYEQPRAISDTLEGRVVNGRVVDEILGAKAKQILDAVEAIQIIACGTSYHAGLVAKYWFEELAGLHCHVEVASEFRYRKHVVRPGTLFVTVSQSGETADSIAALMQSKSKNYVGSLVICNVPESSLVRESDLVLMTHAGPEIGVASTKAFTTQLVALMLLVILVGRRKALTADSEQELVAQLLNLPARINKALQLNHDIESLASQYKDKQHALFLGRGSHHPIAMEGALKLKEISYIHAEAYAAGELKHGPIALVDEDMPVITVAPNNELLEKLKSNIEEVRARGGQLHVFADISSGFNADDLIQLIELDAPDNAVAPIIFTIPLQLLAYHAAVLKGTDVDQPRNLAKSVTVE
ncbi:MAG: glutamine--fructose-6-phosphate transaminase (isomerizing) [Candidatus Thioglobus sp.]|nr:MAG: glutamine--fructose-6-phosphate transaminase (isomerizing) [Candidatus Thioglobus sp.]